jgi:hypothetical protein
MGAFIEYRNRMIFEKLLVEMPEYVPDNSKPIFDQVADKYREHLKNAHNSNDYSIDSGTVSSIHSISPTKHDSKYFHTKDGKIEGISHIVNGVQKFVHKGNSSTATMHSIMGHHINIFGSLSTDSKNTPGSRKLWTTYVKSNPDNVDFHHIHNGKSTNINKDNIDSESYKIWDQSEEGRNHVLKATKRT